MEDTFFNSIETSTTDYSKLCFSFFFFHEFLKRKGVIKNDNFDIKPLIKTIQTFEMKKAAQKLDEKMKNEKRKLEERYLKKLKNFILHDKPPKFERFFCSQSLITPQILSKTIVGDLFHTENQPCFIEYVTYYESIPFPPYSRRCILERIRKL